MENQSLYGYLVGNDVMLVGDPERGKPVITASKPDVPDGYRAVSRYTDMVTQIVQSWSVEPVEGTAEEAVLALARMQAEKLTNEQAALVPALYDEWSGASVDYKEGNRRRYLGKLYRCLQDHTSQPGWNPVDAPSLWAEILPGQDGNEPEEGYAAWVQPGATNGYSTGDRVVDEGHLWESLVNDNVDKPGTDNGFRWKDLGPYPAETGA